jgi:hypothetical protein
MMTSDQYVKAFEQKLLQKKTITKDIRFERKDVHFKRGMKH